MWPCMSLQPAFQKQYCLPGRSLDGWYPAEAVICLCCSFYMWFHRRTRLDGFRPCRGSIGELFYLLHSDLNYVPAIKTTRKLPSDASHQPESFKLCLEEKSPGLMEVGLIRLTITCPSLPRSSRRSILVFPIFLSSVDFDRQERSSCCLHSPCRNVSSASSGPYDRTAF